MGVEGVTRIDSLNGRAHPAETVNVKMHIGSSVRQNRSMLQYTDASGTINFPRLNEVAANNAYSSGETINEWCQAPYADFDHKALTVDTYGPPSGTPADRHGQTGCVSSFIPSSMNINFQMNVGISGSMLPAGRSSSSFGYTPDITTHPSIASWPVQSSPTVATSQTEMPSLSACSSGDPRGAANLSKEFSSAAVHVVAKAAFTAYWSQPSAQYETTPEHNFPSQNYSSNWYDNRGSNAAAVPGAGDSWSSHYETTSSADSLSSTEEQMPSAEQQQQQSMGPLAERSALSTNTCYVCGKGYARPSTLKTHLRTHSGERPYRCSTCHKTFSQAANLTAHLRTHSGEKPFKCTVCDRRFSQSSSVTTHMRTHSGERPYKCRVCRKSFSDSSTLTKHMRVHSGEKPYHCTICYAKFSQSGNLNRHLRVHMSLANSVKSEQNLSSYMPSLDECNPYK